MFYPRCPPDSRLHMGAHSFECRCSPSTSAEKVLLDLCNTGPAEHEACLCSACDTSGPISQSGRAEAAACATPLSHTGNENHFIVILWHHPLILWLQLSCHLIYYSRQWDFFAAVSRVATRGTKCHAAMLPVRDPVLKIRPWFK